VLVWSCRLVVCPHKVLCREDRQDVYAIDSHEHVYGIDSQEGCIIGMHME